MTEIVIHRAPATRSFSVLWMLEELGVSYRSEIVPHDSGSYRSADYLALNPTGLIPTLVDGQTVVRECPAICIYLADRYGYGSLAPRIEEPERGPYLSWLVYSTAQLEAARATQDTVITGKKGNWGVGWAPLPEILDVLEGALAGGPFLLAGRFTAADVMIGATLAMGLHTGEIPKRPIIQAYIDRLAERPAFKTAGALNWGG